MTPNEIASYGAGIVALSILFRLYWRKASSDKSIDDRIIRQLDERDETIRDLHQRNRELTDRYHSAITQSLALAAQHATQTMAAVNDVRREHQEAMVDIRAKLATAQAAAEQAQQDHAACTERVVALERIMGSRV